MKFSDYKLRPFLNEGLKTINFISPTKIQELVLPRAIKRESIIVQSATVSGKTHSFIIPILQNLNLEKEEVQAVIISPTRELATQLYEVLLKLTKCSETPINVSRAIGGVDREQEIKRFEKSQPHIVIGTIGRLNDLVVDSNVLKIHNAKSVIIDEADMIFEEKELEEVDKIMGVVQGNHQFLVFSATIPQGLKTFLKKYLRGIDVISLEEKTLTHKNITHIMVPCKAKDRKDVLLQLMEYINPYLGIIFCNTKETVDELSLFLAEQGLKIGKLHGDLDDRNRKQILKRISNLEFKYIVASDIAARGIDIEGVSHVINYDLPKEVEFYIHRTGRTARFDKTGEAYSLYAYGDDSYVKKLQAKGLEVTFMKLSNGTLSPASAPKRPATKAKTYEEELHQKIRLPKKVKPGYKKKRNEEIKKLVSKAKRKHIDEIYNKRNHRKDD